MSVAFDYAQAAVNYATAEDQNNQSMASSVRQRVFEANRLAYLAGANEALVQWRKSLQADVEKASTNGKK